MGEGGSNRWHGFGRWSRFYHRHRAACGMARNGGTVPRDAFLPATVIIVKPKGGKGLVEQGSTGSEVGRDAVDGGKWSPGFTEMVNHRRHGHGTGSEGVAQEDGTVAERRWARAGDEEDDDASTTEIMERGGRSAMGGVLPVAWGAAGGDGAWGEVGHEVEIAWTGSRRRGRSGGGIGYQRQRRGRGGMEMSDVGLESVIAVGHAGGGSDGGEGSGGDGYPIGNKGEAEETREEGDGDGDEVAVVGLRLGFLGVVEVVGIWWLR